MKNAKITIILLFLTLIFVSSCKKDNLLNESEIKKNNVIELNKDNIVFKVKTKINNIENVILCKENSSYLQCHYDITNKIDDVYNFNYDFNSFPEMVFNIVDEKYIEWTMDGTNYYVNTESNGNIFNMSINNSVNDNIALVNFESNQLALCDIIDYVKNNGNIVTFNNLNKNNHEIKEAIALTLWAIGIAAAAAYTAWNLHCMAEKNNARDVCKRLNYVFSETMCGGLCKVDGEWVDPFDSDLQYY